MKIEWSHESIWGIKWDIQKLSQKAQSGRNYTKYVVDNIITGDTETSTGYFDEHGVCHPYTHELYKANRDAYEGYRAFSVLYLWQVAVEDGDDIHVYFGRTLDGFDDLITDIGLSISVQGMGMSASSRDEALSILSLSKKKTTPNWSIYIHNMPYDFQFLRNKYEDKFLKSARSVFARTMRKPLKCALRVHSSMLTIKDTYCLTQKSLETWSKDANLPVKKRKEPKDFYYPIRTPDTPLYDEELAYSYQDVVAMVYGLRDYRKKYGHLDNIPMTQTGEVRRRCEAAVRSDPAWVRLCQEATLAYDFSTFHRLCEAYCGGWTHANARWAGIHITKDEQGTVVCFDFASSYPAVMCTRRYPVGMLLDCTAEEWWAMTKLPVNERPKMGFARVKVWGVEAKLSNTFWSSSKIRAIGGKTTGRNIVEDNGRVKSAEYFEAEMCDLDFDTFLQAYDYEKIEVTDVKLAKAGYLPKVLIGLILDYYAYKTTLKGDDSKKSLYDESKQFINSIYGCAVTRIISDTIKYLGGSDPWTREEIMETEFEEKMEEQTHKTMFLSYQIGVWVAAWARHNLWDAIIHLDKKVVYCDTDSIKGFFDEKDLAWFDDYNAGVVSLCNAMADRYGFSPDRYRPKTPDKDGVPGKPKPLGIFAREDDAVEFKTLGAKRYMMTVWNTKKGEYEREVTVAGLPKSAGVYVQDYDDFCDQKTWDVDESGKTIMRYEDDQPAGLVFVDRDGNKYRTGRDNRFGIAATPTTFCMSMGEYAEYIQSLMGDYLDANENTAILQDCGV